MDGTNPNSKTPSTGQESTKSSSKFRKFRPPSLSKPPINAPPVVKKTLSPVKSTIMKPINLAASGLASGGTWMKNTLSTDDTDPDEFDLAAPARQMAKSFVGMLTTASIYNGNLQDLIQSVENLPGEDAQAEALNKAVDTVEKHGLSVNREDVVDFPATEGDINDQISSLSVNDTDYHNGSEIESIESIESIDSDGRHIYTPHGQTEGQIAQNSAAAPSPNDALPSNLNKKMTAFEFSIEKKLSKVSLNNPENNSDTKSRAKALGKKLREVFDIDSEDHFIADYSCWLLKDVLLQGHIYLTKSHILFFAFLPKNDKSKTCNSGALFMESNNYLTTAVPTSLKSRYWVVLQGHTLSFHNSSTELYFPVLTIDLRYVVRVDIVNNGSDDDSSPLKAAARGEKLWFEILTENKTYKLQADSSHAARSWVGILKKQIFACKNKGDCVTVKIPLQNVLDLDKTPLVDSAETLKIKVLENPEQYSVDDYFFMFFVGGANAHTEIAAAIQDLNTKNAGIESVLDSTSKVDESSSSVDSPKGLKKRSATFSFPLRNVFTRTRSSSTASTTEEATVKSKPETVSKISNERVVERRILSGGSENDELDEGIGAPISVVMSPNSKPEQEPNHELQYGSRTPPGAEGDPESLVGKSMLPSLSQARSNIIRWTPNVSKLWSSAPLHYTDGMIAMERGEDDPYLQNEKDTVEANQNFKRHFVLNDSDSLVAAYYCYLQKNVPVYGKIYIGSNSICFRSLVFGVSTKMIVPFKDVETCYKEKGFKFGYSGLVLVIHGHEELFFEFNSQTSRDDCEFLLLKQLDKVSSTRAQLGNLQNSSTNLSSSGELERAKIRLFEDKIHNEAGLDIPIIVEDHPIFKTTIKPDKPYKFTCLTIGSRGDVQPYIALAKGLMAEGHSVRIATHSEFKDWVEEHGIEFKEIAGSPTELMSLMVTHGSMNIGLIKEATSKFRGWLTELLATAWEACQGTEILIESPSAFAGIHIAEALGIPYFRAFTMPWTRTRAYPHAFIVPEQKKGGSYNYLTHVLFENILWKGSSGQINKWREETLKISKTNLYQLQQNNAPFLYNISPTVVPAPVDYNDWIKVTGYWFLDEGSGDYTPPEDLSAFMKKARDDGKKLVYIGFGSIVVNNPTELTQAVVDAVLDADVRCILNKGWSERLGGSKTIEVELPEEVFNSGAIPHDWLFQHIDCAVHHGGSGTTGASLRFGLPTIIKPFFGDQFFYANRVEDIGAGIGLKKLNVKSLSKALKECTTNQRIIAKAKAVGVSIRKENGVKTAIDCIYSELEYARELIVQKRAVSVKKYKQEHGITAEDEEKQAQKYNESLEEEVQANEDYNELGGKHLTHTDKDIIGEYDSWLLY
ncbi:hypothetical protein WICPIJ_009472 [Wickerhamomyces pijperi]|uniref:Sterol 3-beta-glucosyltransferase n=1 Tax=Wickerhamomyces pijperi TaxID=599730 RepID=A0A9P8PNG3_WICPI|nr:hypothetical protein WICPIJ_009472 [Wickerhamomyces pijperi]